jgi:hypothetical protein
MCISNFLHPTLENLVAVGIGILIGWLIQVSLQRLFGQWPGYFMFVGMWLAVLVYVIYSGRLWWC